MNTLLIKISSVFTFLYPYRWLLLPLIPFIFFLTFLVSFLFQPTPSQNQTQIPMPTMITDSVPHISPIPTNAWIQGNEEDEPEWEDDPTSLPKFEKKEQRSNGTTLYIYTSDTPDRPNITIRQDSDNAIIFYRERGTTEMPLMDIPLIKKTQGKPEKIIQGSTYYGSQAQIYFYGSQSSAFVVNPATNKTYELQTFPPMSVDEYLQRFKSLN